MQNILECCQYLVYIWVVVGRRVENCEDQREWLMGVWTPRQDPAVLFCIALVQYKTTRQDLAVLFCIAVVQCKTTRQDPAVLFCIAVVQYRTPRQHCSGGLCNTFSLITAYGCDFTMYEVWTYTQDNNENFRHGKENKGKWYGIKSFCVSILQS